MRQRLSALKLRCAISDSWIPDHSKMTSGAGSTKICSSSKSTTCCWARRGGFFPTHAHPRRARRRYPFQTTTSLPALKSPAMWNVMILVPAPCTEGATVPRAAWMQRSALWQGQGLRHTQQYAPAMWAHHSAAPMAPSGSAPHRSCQALYLFQN